MFRPGNHRPLQWADKTMSVLRANQLEACEKDLACLPCRCLFDSDCTDTDAEKLFALSFYAAEDAHHPALHTIESLRVRVLAAFAAEIALLSMEEHDLLVRMVLFGGRIRLHDWDSYIPAQSLVRRLWCKVEKRDGAMFLLMPHQLCASALLLLAGDHHKEVRDLVERVNDSIDNTLYLMGMMQAAAPEHHLSKLLTGTHAGGHPELIRRFLMTGCDYLYDPSGRMLLIHPGLADPDRMIPLMNQPFRDPGGFLDMNEKELTEASDSINDLENPLYERMLFLLMDVIRPELTPEDAVEDLIVLAKQGVSLREMEEVLASMIICLPTPEMLKALKDLSDRIPRWMYLSSTRVQ